MPEIKLEKVDEFIWKVRRRKERGMNVDVTVYASEKLLYKMREDRTLVQAVNVSMLPNIYKHSIVLPDGHEGYGFPIGGVAAFDAYEGIISPGGVGYDINCGVRLLRTNLRMEDVRPVINELVDTIFRNVPSGVGSRGKLRLSYDELDRVLEEGAQRAYKMGFGWEEDFKHCESEGMIPFADATKVSRRAKERGAPQLGSLGSGNHFLEIDVVDRIFDERIAKTLGIKETGQVCVLIHTGSRGLGHQVCSDYLRVLDQYVHRAGIKLPDRELAYAHIKSKEARDYMAAMAAAANYAWANRQFITHWVRESFSKVFRTDPEKLDLHVIYDVAHNIAKLEEHRINGERKKVIVHRKGATRAFPPGHPEIPANYRGIGQPVLIPGSMGTSSWVLIGTETSMERSFGSTAHGAGRLLSRAAATRRYRGSDVINRLRKEGIIVRAVSWRVAAEEAPSAYKDVDEVVRVSHRVGIAKMVVRLVPIGVAKG
ncbi:RNA-splicing ligase RtcB [Candidatus Geothermarchaeota archaeon]|nr:MAG: RNA-splicing ligase RtcB [Candidatus Geothermarchaeota archaeon]